MASVAFDSNGNIWIANIRANDVVEYSGTTPTGPSINGLNSPYGLAFDASGDLWVSGSVNNTVTEYKPPLNGASPSSTISARLNEPQGLAFEAITGITVGSYPHFIAISP